jgi:murein L,D-transpeptidase YafK
VLAAGLIAAALCGAVPARAETQPKADRILVLKGKRLLLLLHEGRVIKAFPIALGARPVGPKRMRGDERTPEGIYVIDGRNPRSQYTLALHISYPDAEDLQRAAAAHEDPGGAIFIHGMPPSFGRSDPVRFFKDWTAGCISVGNAAISEIWNAVDDGTTIEIRP